MFSKLELYVINDINFEPDNILKLSSVTTYIRLGPNNKFTISITRSGNNTSFTAQIKRTPDAQGGQTPINQVIKLLKGNEFKKNHTDYPKDAKTFMSTTIQNLYKNLPNFILERMLNIDISIPYYTLLGYHNCICLEKEHIERKYQVKKGYNLLYS